MRPKLNIHSLTHFSDEFSYVFGRKRTTVIGEFGCFAGLDFISVSGLVNFNFLTAPLSIGKFWYGPQPAHWLIKRINFEYKRIKFEGDWNFN